jgi:hypothetical protein
MAGAERFTLKPPPWLADLIDRVNDLPAEEPDFDNVLKQAMKDEDQLFVLNKWSENRELFQARELLMTVAKQFADWRPLPGVDSYSIDGTAGYPSGWRFRLEANLEIDQGGNLILDPGSVLATILGMPVRQIRICAKPECSKLFWAGRPTQRCCSPLHAQAERMRAARARWKQKGSDYEANRARKEK